jgi:hypothetical protein
MAITGVYQDHYKDMFRDTLLLEAQQMGSRLEQAVRVEPMSGNRTFFDKLGKVSSMVKTSRGQSKTLSDLSFERRQVIETMNSFDTLFDREDLIKYVNDPKSDVVQSAVAALGRTKDILIHNAIAGNAVVTTNGSTSNTALSTAIASGSTFLTTAKLRTAIARLYSNHGISGNERLICIAPADQIIALAAETAMVSVDFRAKKPLEGPGVIAALSGYLGIDFIAFDEQTLLNGSEERVFLITEDAIKLGVFSPLTVEVDRAVERIGNPDILSVHEAIGVTRMFEEKVVDILCTAIA